MCIMMKKCVMTSKFHHSKRGSGLPSLMVMFILLLPRLSLAGLISHACLKFQFDMSPNAERTTPSKVKVTCASHS